LISSENRGTALLAAAGFERVFLVMPAQVGMR